MNEKMREEFSAWYLAEVTQSYGESVRTQAGKNLAWVRQDGSFADPMLRLACLAWQASRETPAIHPPLQQTLRDNGELIAAQATIAQQAQMIEHLRGGPTPGYTAVDMTAAAAQGFRDGVASAGKDAERYQHLKANWEDGLLLERLMGNVLPQDWDAEIDKDMSKESP